MNPEDVPAPFPEEEKGPPIEEKLPEEGEDANDVEPEELSESEFMPDGEADANPTVDNKEEPINGG